MYAIEVRMKSKKSSLSPKEVWNLIVYVFTESTKEGYNPPSHVVVLVLDPEDFKAYSDQGDVTEKNEGFCISFPPSIVVRGDLTSDNLVFILLKLARVLVVYNTLKVTDTKESEEWARRHFMTALSYMVRW